MVRFYFHVWDVWDDLDTPDLEGAELQDIEAARERAAREARLLMCETIKAEGRVTLYHHIDVEDEHGKVLDTICFREAVKIEN